MLNEHYFIAKYKAYLFVMNLLLNYVTHLTNLEDRINFVE